jgi:putative acetyltransferase
MGRSAGDRLGATQGLTGDATIFNRLRIYIFKAGLTDMYTLETPKETDYPTLINIWESSVKATHHFLNDGDIEFFKKTISEHQMFELVHLTVVKDNSNSILGFMGVSNEELDMLFLHPRILRKGIGSMLMKHAIEDFKVKKVDVNEQNTGAVQFYGKFGFEVMSRSEVDGTGKPYPILHMRLKETSGKL